MTPETARAIGYSQGRAAERHSILEGAAKRGFEVLLVPERPVMFVGRCRLCGEAARGVYCAEHEWAYGDPAA